MTNKNTIPKILLGTPIYDEKDYCIQSWIETLEERFSDMATILLVDNSKTDSFFNKVSSIANKSLVERIEPSDNPYLNVLNSRQVIVNKLISENYDYFFSVECDVFPEKSVLPALLAAETNVIGVPYILCYTIDPKSNLKTGYIFSSSGLDTYNVVGGKKVGSFQHTDKTINFSDPLSRVYHVGLGCTLINANVYKLLNIRSEPENKRFDDSLFFEDLKNLNVPVYANNTLIDKVNHYPNFKKLVGWK